MAAPTNVAVESDSITTTHVFWDYSGVATVVVYRSTDGSSYSTVGSVFAGTKTFNDTGLSSATKYWYKLSDDNGSTFSSVVTVVTHTCLPSAGSQAEFVLPRFDDGQPQTPQLNHMAEQIEELLGGRVLGANECLVCVVDGAVVLDCSTGCSNFVVIGDADINSISVLVCDNRDFTVDFIIPANTTRAIGGWPSGFGIQTDTGRKDPFATGASGGHISVSSEGGKASPGKSSGSNTYGKGGASGGGGAGSGCTCTPLNNALTIKSCSADNSLDCQSTKTLKLLVCGGQAPYSWSRSGSVTLQGSKQAAGATATGTSVIVRPPTNSGSGVSGTAYYRCFRGQVAAEPCSCENCRCAHGCNDGSLGCVTLSSECTTPQPVIYLVTTPLPGCTPATSGGIPNCQPASPATVLGTCGAAHGTGTKNGTITDKRTAQMISDGCNPCGLQGGTTVSVTDANGVTATIILRP